MSTDELRDMYALHTLFRREFGLAPVLVRELGEGDAVDATVVCQHIDLMLRLLMSHHVNGEYPELHAARDEVALLMRFWCASASALDAKPLAVALEGLSSLVNQLMARREEAILWPRTAALSA
jgi:hypothetical protein